MTFMNMAHLRESNTGEQPNSDFNDSVCCLVYFCKIINFFVKSEIYMLAKLQHCITLMTMLQHFLALS